MKGGHCAGAAGQGRYGAFGESWSVCVLVCVCLCGCVCAYVRVCALACVKLIRTTGLVCGKYGILTLSHTGNLLKHRQEEFEHFNVRKGLEANRLRLQLAELQV